MISVVISLFNKETSILNTLNAVLNQTFADFELLVVNDGSTDRSLEMIDEIHDKRLKIINKVNGGVSSARNAGILEAQGDFVFLLDADDIIYPNALEIFNELLTRYPEADFYTANYELIEKSKVKNKCHGKTEGYINNPMEMYWKKNIAPRIGNTMIRRTIFKSLGLFSTEMSLYEDFDFNIRFLSHCRVVYSPKVVMSYIREYSILSKKKMPLEKEYCWYINLDKLPYYKKLLLADNINRSIFGRLRRKDFKTIFFLIKKNKKHSLFLGYALFYSLLIRLK